MGEAYIIFQACLKKKINQIKSIELLQPNIKPTHPSPDKLNLTNATSEY